MRRHSDGFTIIVIMVVTAIGLAAKSIYEDLFKAAVGRLLNAWFPGMGAEVMGRLLEVTIALTAGIAVVYFYHLYLVRDFERKRLVFSRHLQTPEGEFGHYTAYLTVENSSDIQKMNNCRCELLELRDESGEVLYKNVGLRTKNQENKSVQGRFNMDQASMKEVPLFNIDQEHDELTIVNADGHDLSLDSGIYTAKVRAYGDVGQPDEITVRIDSNNCNFVVVSK